MSRFYKICKITLLALIIMLWTLITSISYGYLDAPLTRLVELYFNTKYSKVDNKLSFHVHKLRVSKNNISIEKVIIKNTDAKYSLELQGISVNINFHRQNTTNVVTTANIEGAVLLQSEHAQSITIPGISINHITKLFSFFSETILSINAVNTMSHSVSSQNEYIINSVTCNRVYKHALNQQLSCNIKFNQKSDVSIRYTVANQDNTINISANDVPVILYKLAYMIMPQNDILAVFNQYIKAGEISNATVKVSVHNPVSNEDSKTINVNGQLNVDNLEFQYDEYFPPLKQAKLTATLTDSKLKILLEQAYSSSTKISQATIDISWADLNNAMAIVHGIAVGPAVDLTDFIPHDTLHQMYLKGLDLRKLNGMARSVIDITIPLDAKVKNSYCITTDIANANLEGFNHHLKLHGANISGLFDSNIIKLQGKGLINDFSSNLNYYYDLKNDSHTMQVKTSLSCNDPHKTCQLGPIHVISGTAIFNSEYKNTAGKEQFAITSDLTNLEFDITKLFIHKFVGDKANIKINNIPGQKNLLALSVLGANLNITGNVGLESKGFVIKLPRIQHKNTDLQCEIIKDSNDFAVTIYGKQLDLATANMMQFLHKSQENTNINIKVALEHVQLKSGVQLNELKMKIKCNKQKCVKGYLDSKMGSKFLKMILQTENDKEEWVVTSNDAGAILRGIGLYKNVYAGSIAIIMHPNRGSVKVGEIVPIVQGSFMLKRFVVKDLPFITKLVSFISLPGFLNFITNNDYVRFSDMSGEFNYHDNVINIASTQADGLFFDMTAAGKIDTAKRKIELRGRIIPSLYGINAVLGKVPIFGAILSGKHRKGVIFAPYSIMHSY